MFKQLSRAEFLTLALTHKRIIVYKEVLGDCMTPIQVYQALQHHMQDATLLESSPKEKNVGRYSFLGYTQLAQLCIKNGVTEIKDEAGVRNISGDVLQALRDFYQHVRAYTPEVLSGFVGGITGFVSYDAARLFESALPQQINTDFPDILFKCYRDHIIFDQKTGQVFLATLVDVHNQAADFAYDAAIKRLDQFQHEMSTAPIEQDEKTSNAEPVLPLQTSMDDAAYLAAGEKAKAHIAAGDAFQIVLARTFKMPYTAKPFDIYRILRLRNPSPYMFYLSIDDSIICGASPEKMISVKDNIVQSCPLAGTRPRGGDYNDDLQAADLLNDTKEVAEHMMLVDLARNDIGRVAKPGSVTVSALKQIQQFSHVMHISSTVEAPLREGYDALDALKAAFPAGTLSGAPKIRAMQIIHELEGAGRKLYGGMIGFIDSKGNFDSCIAIRMAVLQNGVASVSAGAGIVADSELQKEADETRHKARAVLEAILDAQRGLV